MTNMFDVCVIGHITKDIIRVNGEVKKEQPGGTAYYTSIALNSLGLQVAVITKTSGKDRDNLLAELDDRGIAVFWQESPETTVFENIYQSANLDDRLQRVGAIAAPFTAADVAAVNAKFFHIGALTNQDIAPDFWAAASQKCHYMCLDGQGFLRQVTDTGEVVNVPWVDKQAGLSYIDILKVDRKEARLLSGEQNHETAAVVLGSYGPKEVLVTAASKGSLVYHQGKFYQIPAFPPQQTIDPTGCGDTYVAGYIYQRIRSSDLEQVGRFAAQVATRKLENFGPLTAWVP
ncbi:MAG TPA: ribokinase [Oscillatoriaceae cyanobacterium M33_DOE_052]|uniref:Ribokinase n=1 Tax=Planktothricoides sp. SpSt-374 TaxID=2282167 RepID=A0A7C3VM71_9CYAN|nr:ribokinase [Oscillatoriaceae cyanobacterium M33_DOE_052]